MCESEEVVVVVADGVIVAVGTAELREDEHTDEDEARGRLDTDLAPL